MKNYCLSFLLLLASATSLLAMETTPDEVDPTYLQQLEKKFQKQLPNKKATQDELVKTLANLINNELGTLDQPTSPKKGQSYRHGSKPNQKATKIMKRFNTIKEFHQKQKPHINNEKANQDIEQAIECKRWALYMDFNQDGGTFSIEDMIQNTKSSNYDPRKSERFENLYNARFQQSESKEQTNESDTPKKSENRKSLRKSLSNLLKLK